MLGALAAHCDAIAGPADPEARLGEATEIVDGARALGDRRLELLGRRLRLVARLELGDLAGAEADAAAFRSVAERLGQPVYAWYGPLWTGMAAARTRRPHGGALRAGDEAEALGLQAHSANAQMLVQTQRWVIATFEDRVSPDDIAGLDALAAGHPEMAPWMRVTLRVRAGVLRRPGGGPPGARRPDHR